MSNTFDGLIAGILGIPKRHPDMAAEDRVDLAVAIAAQYVDSDRDRLELRESLLVASNSGRHSPDARWLLAEVAYYFQAH